MSASETIIHTGNLGRSFRVGSEEVVAVHDVTMEVRSGQFIAIVGRSGSGKTTLLNLMAGLDKPTSGTVTFEGRDLSRLTAKELTQIRRHKIGFVFQSFGLLPLLSAFENVELPLRISGVKRRERESRVQEALDGRTDPQGQTPALRAVGRRATARRHCPGHRHPSADTAGGRAYR